MKAPDAIFVVERRPGQGYGVTSSQGPQAASLQRAAVEILNLLGQPDPRGPEEIQRWIPNAGPQQQSLFVRIRRTPEGESVYHQAWFAASGSEPVQPPAPGGNRGWLAWILFLLMGGVLGWMLRGSLAAPPSIEQPSPGGSATAPPPVLPDPAALGRTDAALQVPVRLSREVRKKLHQFLGQPGLTGWPEEADTVEQTVELRDFRKTPRGVKIDPLYLTSDEVRSLRRLLETLEGVSR